MGPDKILWHSTVKAVEIRTGETIVGVLREKQFTKAGKSEEGEAPPPSFFPGWDPVSAFFYCMKWGVLVVISSQTLAATLYAQGKGEDQWQKTKLGTKWSEGNLLAWQELLSYFSLLQPPNCIVSSLIESYNLVVSGNAE